MKIRVTPAIAAVLIAFYAITVLAWVALVVAGKLDVSSGYEILKVLGSHTVGLGLGAYGVNLYKKRLPIEINGSDSDPPATPQNTGGKT